MFEFIVGILQTVSKQYQYHPDAAENVVFTRLSGLLHLFPLNVKRHISYVYIYFRWSKYSVFDVLYALYEFSTKSVVIL